MRRLLLSVTALMLTVCVSTVAGAHEVKIGEIEIEAPYARAMLPGAKVGGGYLKITNAGPADRLVSAKAERAASVQLHEMKIDGGIMVMRELKDGIAVPAKSSVELKPGSYHVMFMNVGQPFKEGELVKTTLKFEKAGSVDVEFAVGPAAGGAPAMKHDDHTAAHAAHGSMPTMAAMPNDLQQAIPAAMKAMFETADKPLSVEPVVVQGDWAIAGWIQDGRGGRALLRKKDTGWSVHSCSGDGLKQVQGLRMMGLSEGDATAIAAKLFEAEKNIAPEKLALFGRFEGTVVVEGKEADAHGQHLEHGK